MSQPVAIPSPRRRLWKGVLFRVGAVLLGCLPLLLAEGALRVWGLGRPTDHGDPFVGFSDVHPLFVHHEQSGRMEIAQSRRKCFRPDSFLADKPADEFRIFVLGGSTVQGRPYAIETSFTTWLELSLNAAAPARRWEVVNCGGISYATYRLVLILQEILHYQPDLVIVCTGVNEFLEDRTYGHLKTTPAVLAWPQRQAARLRTYTLLREGLLQLKGQPDETADRRPVLPPDVDAILDWKNGLAQYHRDPDWHQGVVAHFAFNLRRMADLAAAAGVPLLFIREVSNLEWPPFKSEHRHGITDAERADFRALLDAAQRQARDNLEGAVELLQQAVNLDPEHALAHFELGTCYQHLGWLSEAKAELVKAKDLDVCPLRMLEPMRPVFYETAAATGTPLVDAEAVIAERSAGGIPGRQWLIDHVHPTLEGHQLLALVLVDEFTRQGFLRPAPGWQAARDRAYAEHLSQLSRVDAAYFARGQQQLQAVQRWARGLAIRERGAATTRDSPPAASP